MHTCDQVSCAAELTITTHSNNYNHNKNRSLLLKSLSVSCMSSNISVIAWLCTLRQYASKLQLLLLNVCKMIPEQRFHSVKYKYWSSFRFCHATLLLFLCFCCFAPFHPLSTLCRPEWMGCLHHDGCRLSRFFYTEMVCNLAANQKMTSRWMKKFTSQYTNDDDCK